MHFADPCLSFFFLLSIFDCRLEGMVLLFRLQGFYSKVKQNPKSRSLEAKINDRRPKQKAIDLRSAAAVDGIHDGCANADKKSMLMIIVDRSRYCRCIDRTDRHRDQPAGNKTHNKCDKHDTNIQKYFSS